MIVFFAQMWKELLKVGYDPSLPGLEKSRTMLLNALVVATSTSVIFYCIGFLIAGHQYYYGTLFAIPPSLLVFYLNYRGKYSVARFVYAVASLVIVCYWCYVGRRNGNEFVLIGLAVTSTLIFTSRWIIWLMNILCIIIYVIYKVHDATHPFVPDPTLNYDVLPVIILFNTVGVVVYQMAFFKDLTKHHDDKIRAQYGELNNTVMRLQKTEEELTATNEELRSSNDQLYSLTNQLEVIVKQKTNELESYIEAINVNMFSFINDLNGNFIRVNDPFLSACGYTREDLIGHNYDRLAPSHYPQSVFEERRQHLLTGRSWRGEVESIAKNGSRFWFDCVIMPLKDNSNSVKYFMSLGLPITERKVNEQMREQTQNVLETIAFRTSHNIRGPLSRMQGLAGLIQKDLIKQDEFNWVAENLLISAQEIDTVTKELIEFVNTHYDGIQDIKSKKED